MRSLWGCVPGAVSSEDAGPDFLHLGGLASFKDSDQTSEEPLLRRGATHSDQIQELGIISHPLESSDEVISSLTGLVLGPRMVW